jgi:hypothetical protein
MGALMIPDQGTDNQNAHSVGLSASQLALGLQPIVNISAICVAALLKQLVRTLRDGVVKNRSALRASPVVHSLVPTSRLACHAAMSDSRHATRRRPTRTGCGNVPAFIFR